MLYYTVLYYSILYCTVLYYTTAYNANGQDSAGSLPELLRQEIFNRVSLKGANGTQGLTRYVRVLPRTLVEGTPDHRNYLLDRIPPGNPTLRPLIPLGIQHGKGPCPKPALLQDRSRTEENHLVLQSPKTSLLGQAGAEGPGKTVSLVGLAGARRAQAGWRSVEWRSHDHDLTVFTFPVSTPIVDE